MERLTAAAASKLCRGQEPRARAALSHSPAGSTSTTLSPGSAERGSAAAGAQPQYGLAAAKPCAHRQAALAPEARPPTVYIDQAMWPVQLHQPCWPGPVSDAAAASGVKGLPGPVGTKVGLAVAHTEHETQPLVLGPSHTGRAAGCCCWSPQSPPCSGLHFGHCCCPHCHSTGRAKCRRKPRAGRAAGRNGCEEDRAQGTAEAQRGCAAGLYLVHRDRSAITLPAWSWK